MTFGHPDQFVDAKFPASLFPFFATVGAEGTMVDADIGGFEVDVPVEKNLFPIDFVPYMIRQNSQKRQGSIPEKPLPIIGRNAFTGRYFFCNFHQFG